MKKFYTLILSAALMGSASATARSLQLPVAKQITTAAETGRIVKQSAVNSDFAPRFEGKTVKSIRKADGKNTLEGIWTFSLGDYYMKESIGGTIRVNFEATFEGSELWFEDPNYNVLPFVGVYDAEASTISFSREFIGDIEEMSGGYYSTFQQPFRYIASANTTQDIDVLVANYNAEKGSLTFTPDQGLCWAAYTSQTELKPTGYFGFYDFVSATQEAEADPDALDEKQEGLWTSIGNATFVDAFILPGYTMAGVMINPNDYAYEVELQQNVADKNIYRLWKPYTNGKSPLTDLNESKYQGQIQFDLSDPNYVVVIANDMPAGFKNRNGEFYLSNELGWMINNMGGNEYKNMIIAQLYGDESVNKSDADPDTYKNGVITIHTPMFDFTPDHPDGYQWTNNPYFALVKFPGSGVDAIGADTAAKVRYYNLQGVEVAAPADGIFIKVEGSKTTKVVK